MDIGEFYACNVYRSMMKLVFIYQVAVLYLKGETFLSVVYLFWIFRSPELNL